MSQPSRVAKDAARGELLGCKHRLRRQAAPRRSLTPSTLHRLGRAYEKPPVTAAAQSACERAPSPQREQYEMTRSPISSNRRPFTRTTAWADLLEKAEAKDAAGVAASEGVEMAEAGAAGAAAGAGKALCLNRRRLHYYVVSEHLIDHSIPPLRRKVSKWFRFPRNGCVFQIRLRFFADIHAMAQRTHWSIYTGAGATTRTNGSL